MCLSTRAIVSAAADIDKTATMMEDTLLSAKKDVERKFFSAKPPWASNGIDWGDCVAALETVEAYPFAWGRNPTKGAYWSRSQTGPTRKNDTDVNILPFRFSVGKSLISISNDRLSFQSG